MRETFTVFALRSTGRELRRIRAQQWKLSLSFHHAWLWLQAVMPSLQSDASRCGVSREDGGRHYSAPPSSGLE